MREAIQAEHEFQLLAGPVGKALKANRRTGVINQQAHMEIVGDRAHPVDQVRVGQVHRQNLYLNVIISPDRTGQRFQWALPACQEHQVNSHLRQLAGEGFTDPLGTAGNNGPGAVAFGKVRGERHAAWSRCA